MRLRYTGVLTCHIVVGSTFDQIRNISKHSLSVRVVTDVKVALAWIQLTSKEVDQGSIVTNTKLIVPKLEKHLVT